MEHASTASGDAMAHDDLLLRGMPPVNLMLTGGHGVVRTVLGALLRDFHGRITAWYPGEQLALPLAPPAGAIILHEVGLMEYDDQLRLLDWLERRLGRTQIVSTTSTPLLPKVESGAFNDTLYYRLNTVSVDMSSDALTESSEFLRSRAG
jgi:hypothetical protein